MVTAKCTYTAIGGNRHPAAADWDPRTGLLAYGADWNVALWYPSSNLNGVHALLSGHTDLVTAIRFLYDERSKQQLILSGSVDSTIRIWSHENSLPIGFSSAVVLSDHQGTINAFAADHVRGIFASGSADRTVKIWRTECSQSSGIHAVLLQSISPKTSFIPLALALSPVQAATGALILAVAGTKSAIHIYVAEPSATSSGFKLQATLTGHEGWIRSLALVEEPGAGRKDLLLASASQDKYIRLWRIHQGDELPAANSVGSDPALGQFGKSLSNKAQRFKIGGLPYSTTFEALLLGHEDWIYTARWRKHGECLQLLTSSADNSLAMWQPDESTGIWICTARLGEISGQKGSTSATGSTGGFWIGLWSPDGEAVASLGRSGGWRLWRHDMSSDQWLQDVAITGHVKEVTAIAWAKQGQYLLSASSDQTTRLFAEWQGDQESSWHEFARPQIHGYDLNCIDTLPESQFISGADEKLLRVFDEPVVVARLLQLLCGIENSKTSGSIDAADMPVLGLSNKAVQIHEERPSPADADGDEEQVESSAQAAPQRAVLELDRPPFEDHLARHTLWPEREKLYGHGYEISAVAASQDGSIVATACRASSIDHAVIRLFETTSWHEIKPPLAAHTLSVIRLRFSNDDHYLLSVGRDRRWSIFERETDHYRLVASEPKAHSRMILDASWAPVEVGRVFATASRDRSVKLWKSLGDSGKVQLTSEAVITASEPVTAVSFLPKLVSGTLRLALGLEGGNIQIHCLKGEDLSKQDMYAIDRCIAPARPITQLAWRPLRSRPQGVLGDSQEDDFVHQLAVASEDSSVRIYSVRF